MAFRKISAEKFAQRTTRKRIEMRGGGIEIDLTKFGFKGEKMSAYQNYLGGGLLGSVANDSTIKTWEDNEKLKHIASELGKYYAQLWNEAFVEDEEDEMDYEFQQGLPVSAY